MNTAAINRRMVAFDLAVSRKRSGPAPAPDDYVPASTGGKKGPGLGGVERLGMIVGRRLG